MPHLIRCLLSALTLIACATPAQAERPNVIFIITDDQGYGDVGAHGNDLIQTPNLDKLHGESVRLTDYHTDPTCSPTRASLMTGRYSTRTGIWHTINGRSIMHGDEYTLAEYFKDNGYHTAMFGKWHLGDNAPCRPVDQGFDHAVWHKGGGVTQGPDYLDNDYFDDTYVDHDGEYKKFDGYCTDVWFREAIGYIDDAKEKDEPFFVYLSTNAPHGPFIVDEKYSQPYKDLGIPEQSANFYGMITNIDENLGKLRAYLKDNGLSENTILIYTTDNGTARGRFKSKTHPEVEGFNAGMRAQKGSEYDGGHRVPFFLHWPAKRLDQGRDVDALCGHIDILPTLGIICDLNLITEDELKRGPLDGRSLGPAVLGYSDLTPTGVRFVHSQRVHDPIKWRKSAVMTERWRLVNGKELYDIKQAPGQQNDIADANPAVVQRLRQQYDRWWDSLKPVFDEPVRYDLGGAENPTTLMSHDWLMEQGNAAWHQNHVRRNALINGPFMVNIKKAGKYRITPMRWPAYVDKTSGVVQARFNFELHHKEPGQPAAVGNGGDTDPAQPVRPFTIDLPAGPATLKTTLTREDGKTFGAYYVKIEYLGKAE